VPLSQVVLRNRQVANTQISATANDKWSSSIPVVGTQLQVKIQKNYVAVKKRDKNIFEKRK
jgi:hypothetical protein